MRGMGQGATLALLLHFVLGPGLSAPALAQGPEENPAALGTCHEGQHLQVTLAMPREYFETEGSFRFEAKGDRKRQVCASYAVGTTYQLLSWLENGAVQAAAL